MTIALAGAQPAFAPAGYAWALGAAPESGRRALQPVGDPAPGHVEGAAGRRSAGRRRWPRASMALSSKVSWAGSTDRSSSRRSCAVRRALLQEPDPLLRRRRRPGPARAPAACPARPRPRRRSSRRGRPCGPRARGSARRAPRAARSPSACSAGRRTSSSKISSAAPIVASWSSSFEPKCAKRPLLLMPVSAARRPIVRPSSPSTRRQPRGREEDRAPAALPVRPPARRVVCRAHA